MLTIINLILSYNYLIIFILAIVEGPFLALLLGYLVYTGYINFYLTFFILFFAEMGRDIFCYRLGRYGNKKILESKYFSKSVKTAKNLSTLEYMWHEHTKKTMFLGKLAYAISLPIIISAGMAKLPFKKFILTSMPIGIFQISVLLLVGYYLGSSYEMASQYIKYPGIIIAILIVLVLTLYFSFSNYFTKLFKKTTKVEVV